MLNIKKEYLIIVSSVLIISSIYWVNDDSDKDITKNPIPTEFVEKKKNRKEFKKSRKEYNFLGLQLFI